MRLDLNVTTVAGARPVGWRCVQREESSASGRRAPTPTSDRHDHDRHPALGIYRGIWSPAVPVHVDRPMVFHRSPTAAAGPDGNVRARQSRVAHDQPRQRGRPEHLAAVRPDESQCAAAILGRDDEFPATPTPSCGRHRGHRHELFRWAGVGEPNWFGRLSRPGTCRTGTGSPHASSIWTWWGAAGGGPAHALPIEYMEGP